MRRTLGFLLLTVLAPVVYAHGGYSIYVDNAAMANPVETIYALSGICWIVLSPVAFLVFLCCFIASLRVHTGK